MISRCCWLLVANDTPHSEVYVSLQNRRTIPWAHGIEISSTTHSCASNLRCKFSNQTEIWRWPPYEIETHFFSDVNRCHSCNGCASFCAIFPQTPHCVPSESFGVNWSRWISGLRNPTSRWLCWPVHSVHSIVPLPKIRGPQTQEEKQEQQ